MSDINLESPLVWGLFDKMHVDFEDPIPALEYYNPKRFYREHHVFRPGDFATRVVELGPKVQLPTGSILHILDDVGHEEHSDTPRVNENVFLQRETFKKFIYHVRAPELHGIIDIEDKFIYKQAGLPTTLMSFRNQQRSNFRYCNTLREIPTKRECLVVINHNPLFRVKVFGRLKFFRRMQIVLSSILNTAMNLLTLEITKPQYIYLPWGEEIYPASLFVRTRERLTPATVRHPESWQFILMMHLVNFMWDKATTSLFSKIPEDKLQYINLILTRNGKFIFYNLADLKKLNPKNRVYYKFVNQLNTLSLAGRIDEDSPQEVKEEAKKHFTVQHFSVADTSALPGEKEQDVKSTSVSVSLIAPKVGKTTALETKEPTEQHVEEKLVSVAQVIPKSTKRPKTTVNPDPSSEFREIIGPVPVNNTSTPAEVIDTPQHATIKDTNSTQIEELTLEEETYLKDYMSLQDKATDDFIDQQDYLTPDQKTRYKRISKAYKKVKLGKETIEEILSKPGDCTISQTDLDPKELGFLPDLSSLHSSIANYDKDYVEKMFPRHLASILISFQKVGCFLTGLKVKKEITELNNLTHFTASFEDIHGRTSTIHFRLPTPNRDGKMKVDGIVRSMKKQRFNLPIVKISDTEISLASNYNKTRVIRNTTKAHSFFHYINSFLNSEKSKALVTLGNCVLNIPISYEYVSLAERYKEVSWKAELEVGAGETAINLWFDYNHRAQHFEGEEKDLAELENQYGVYFGKTSKNHLFINVQNQVSAVAKTGGEDTTWHHRTLIPLFKTALREGESVSKQLTEWLTVKFLDAFIPLIFVLAYRFGLRAMLDYMGVKYVITEKRSRLIVGESGQESFGAGMDRVAGNLPGDSIFDGTDWIKFNGQGEPAQEDFTIGSSLTLKDPKVPPLSTDRVRGIEELKQLKLDPDRYNLGGSSAMVVWGVTDQNADIDIGLDPDYEQELMKQGRIVEYTDELGRTKRKFKDTEIDCGVVGPDQVWSQDMQAQCGTVNVDGISVDNIYTLFKFYHILWEHAPTEQLKQKREKQLKALRSTVSKWFGGVVWHAGPKQDLTELDPNYNVHKPKGSTPSRTYASYWLQFALMFGIKWDDDIVNLSWTVSETDGLTITMDLTFKKRFKLSELQKPFSLYKLKDTTFEHMLEPPKGKIFGHPIAEVVSEEKTKVLQEYKFDSWWDAMLDLEAQGILTINRKELIEDDTETLQSAGLTENRKYRKRPDDIEIKFADRNLYFSRYPIAHSLILAGLDAYDLTKYDLADFESKDVYYQLLMDKKMSINYLKGIDSFFDLFMDPMTYQTLELMHEPTNVRDLFLRCAVLLSTTDYRVPSSRLNHKIRGMEQYAAVLYNEMARQCAAYQARRGRANAFTVNPDAIFLRIIQNASVVTSYCVNPLEDIKELTAMTYAGSGGRTAESFVIEDRRFAEDDIGVIAESTPDNPKVGINANLSLDPGLTNNLGVLNTPPLDELKPANAFSMHALVFPFASHDDSKRINFIALQHHHTCPISGQSKSRVCTGYEKIVGKRIHDRAFAGTMERDGIVESIDTKTHLVTVKYKDGSKDVFPFGEQYLPFEGFYITEPISLMPGLEVGSKLKAGDYVTYNTGFFNIDTLTGQLEMTLGAIANVAFMEIDVVNEDSTEISQRLANKLTMYPVNVKVVRLNRRSVVHKCVKVGEHVNHSDPLMVFEEEPIEGASIFQTDEETMKLIADLNRRTPHAGYSGKVVKIEAYYGCEIDAIHPDLQSIVKECVGEVNRRSRAARGTENEEDYPPSSKMPDGSKYKGVTFDKDTVALLFYIQEEARQGAGDKVVICNQLKCTCAGVFPQPILTESGREVDAFFSVEAMGRRCVVSPILYGLAARCMEKLEEDVLNIYFDKK